MVTWGRISSLWGWQSTGTGCPGRLWSLLLWRYSSPTWTRSCAACSRWPCFGRGVELGDPQRSLPTPNILWYCDTNWEPSSLPWSLQRRTYATLWTLFPSKQKKTFLLWRWCLQFCFTKSINNTSCLKCVRQMVIHNVTNSCMFFRWVPFCIFIILFPGSDILLWKSNWLRFWGFFLHFKADLVSTVVRTC